MIAQMRKDGIPDLREQGRRRIIEGLTTVEEILRVTKEED
jgi:type II secretory ATPase GspE/PulE/Tfp pilus assembly ATPase PilB-like protein